MDNGSLSDHDRQRLARNLIDRLGKALEPGEDVDVAINDEIGWVFAYAGDRQVLSCSFDELLLDAPN